jgi:hypothetical protein
MTDRAAQAIAGQAAYEAWDSLLAPADEHAEWELREGDVQAAWKHIAAAALAARQPHAAPRLTPHDLVDQAIGLFLEFRDQHGHDEQSARAAAALEVAEGAAVTDEDLAAREPDAADGDVLRKRFFHLASELENDAAYSPSRDIADALRLAAQRIRKALDTEQPEPQPAPGLRDLAVEVIAAYVSQVSYDETPQDRSRVAGWQARLDPEPQPAPEPADDGESLSGHVAVRFPADLIAAAKQLAAAEGMTVSAWIRREVEREAARREQPAPGLAAARPLDADFMAEVMAERDQLRRALENVFTVLDRQALTYAERISYARTLIRTAREGK